MTKKEREIRALEREKIMFDVMALTRESFGKLFEGGSGVLGFHNPETVELGADPLLGSLQIV